MCLTRLTGQSPTLQLVTRSMLGSITRSRSLTRGPGMVSPHPPRYECNDGEEDHGGEGPAPEDDVAVDGRGLVAVGFSGSAPGEDGVLHEVAHGSPSIGATSVMIPQFRAP